MIRLLRCALICVGLLVATPGLKSQQLFADEGVRYSLFNGQNLDGWVVTGCQVAVADRKLVLQEGNGFVRTEHRYRDFVLDITWRALKSADWDSGIYIRSDLPPAGKSWPARYQVNLKQGQEGNLIGQPQAKSAGLVKPGQWNRFVLTVVGTSAKLAINGQPAWEATISEPADGYIGIQAEVPLGGQFEFQDIFVTELDHRPLFNGQDLAGWEGAGDDASLCWKVADGLLTCTGAKGPWLRSAAELDDFNLRLEYKLKPGGNSGVYVRVPADGNHHGPASGVEIQILDDRAERYRDLKPYQYAGSVYDIAPAEQHVGRDAGQWNSLEIDCRGQSYWVTHNGVVVARANPRSHPDIVERRLNGYLGLQNHSEEVWYRNVRVGPSLQANSPAAEPGTKQP